MADFMGGVIFLFECCYSLLKYIPKVSMVKA